jgi:hypothetical protein
MAHFQEYVGCLFSYEDFQAMVHSGVLPQLCETRIKTSVSARLVLAACGIAPIAHALGPFFLTLRICERLDSLVSRPDHARSDAGWESGSREEDMKRVNKNQVSPCEILTIRSLRLRVNSQRKAGERRSEFTFC